MKKITLEEHISFPDMMKRLPKEKLTALGWPREDDASPSMKKGLSRLAEIGGERLKWMDDAGINMQVLSLAGAGADVLPPDEAVDFAKEFNHRLKKKIDEHPERFAGFAHLAVSVPDAAAAELERAVKELKLCGALISGMTENLFLDDDRFAPLLKKAEELDVPLYLHPSFPPAEVRKAYYSGMPVELNNALASAGFGWHAETAVHILRLIVSGTLDKYPRLQIIIGHMGEMLPSMMYRAETVMPKSLTGSKRSVSEILRSQVCITRSGIFTVPPLQLAVNTFGIDNILFSVDYPYSDNMDGKKFLDSLPLDAKDAEAIAYKNAERLLKLKIE